jgi:hypothetical protein
MQEKLANMIVEVANRREGRKEEAFIFYHEGTYAVNLSALEILHIILHDIGSHGDSFIKVEDHEAILGMIVDFSKVHLQEVSSLDSNYVPSIFVY